jgi:hypothetical protein
MNISRNFIKVFLALFLIIIILNIISVILDSWRYVYGFALLFMTVFTGLLFTRRKNKVFFHMFVYLLILLIVVSIFCPIYLYFQNRQVKYNYDIGSIEDKNVSVLYPTDRISNADINTSSRNLLSQLVYFNVPSRNFDKINITLKILENFPENGVMILALKNDSKWNYVENTIFNKTVVQNSASGNWTFVTSTFNLDDAYVANKTLTFLINVPHLGDFKTRTDYIAIDSINITYFN